MTINVSKCCFGVKPLPHKVEVIKNFKKPAVAKDLKKFIAMINFYILTPQMVLQKLIVGNRKNDTTPIDWNPEAEEAFQQCKGELANATLLAFLHPSAELSICVDASTKPAME